MPEISRFFGIIITMYYNDHGSPHFHARYGEHKAKIAIASGAALEGNLPRRVSALVEEWRLAREIELLEVWQLILERKSHAKIQPLE